MSNRRTPSIPGGERPQNAADCSPLAIPARIAALGFGALGISDMRRFVYSALPYTLATLVAGGDLRMAGKWLVVGEVPQGGGVYLAPTMTDAQNSVNAVSAGTAAGRYVPLLPGSKYRLAKSQQIFTDATLIASGSGYLTLYSFENEAEAEDLAAALRARGGASAAGGVGAWGNDGTIRDPATTIVDKPKVLSRNTVFDGGDWVREVQADALNEDPQLGNNLDSSTTGVKLSYTAAAGVNGLLTSCTVTGGATGGATWELQLDRAGVNYTLWRGGVPTLTSLSLVYSGPIPFEAGDIIQLNVVTLFAASTADAFLGIRPTRRVI